MNWIKKLMQRPTVLAIANDELYEAEMDLLKALSAQDYATSMVAYNVERVNRLRGFIEIKTRNQVQQNIQPIRVRLGDE